VAVKQLKARIDGDSDMSSVRVGCVRDFRRILEAAIEPDSYFHQR
jgi:hypothetical protein